MATALPLTTYENCSTKSPFSYVTHIALYYIPPLLRENAGQIQAREENFSCKKAVLPRQVKSQPNS